MSLTVGVDPGLTGAFAVVDSYGVLVDVYDMPVLAGDVSPQLIEELDDWTDGPFGAFVIEDVGPFPGQSPNSMFRFGRSKGVIEGVFAGLRLPVHYVTPARWKRDLGLSKDKGASRQRAVELWPTKAALFARVKDDGRAEASLIAYWHIHYGEGRGR